MNYTANQTSKLTEKELTDVMKAVYIDNKPIDFHIVHYVDIKFGYLDRLKILFGKKVHVEVKIETNFPSVEVNKTKTTINV